MPLNQWKKLSLLLTAAGAGTLGTPTAFAGSFVSPNDLVLVQCNNDGGSGNSDSVTLYEYNPSSFSAPVNSLNLPDGTLSYNGVSGLSLTLPQVADQDGQLTLATDGHSLEMGTYLNAVGSLAGNASGTFPSNVPRVATALYANGTINDSTQLSAIQDSNGNVTNYFGDSIRAVASLDGTQFWTAGNGGKSFGESTAGDSGGLRYATLGSNDALSLNANYGVDMRTPAIAAGQLFSDTGSDNSYDGQHTFFQVGTGIPTANASSGAPGFTNAPTYNVVTSNGISNGDGSIQGNQSPKFVTLANGTELLYESNSTHNWLTKYALINGVWTGLGDVVLPGVSEDVAVSVSGNTATVFASTYTNISEVVDNGGSGSLGGVAAMTTVYTTPGGTATLRGIAFAPSSSAAVTDQIWGNLTTGAGTTGGSWATATNWAEDDGSPSAAGETVTFGPANPGLISSGTVTLDGNQTVGHIVFNNTAADYTVAQGTGGQLIINNNDPNASGVPSIYNDAGTHTISAPLNLSNGVTIANEYQSLLTISGPIYGSGGVQIYGPGSLVLSGSSSYTGPTAVHSGSVLLPSGGSFPTTTDLTVGDDSDLLAANIAVGTTALTTFNASTGTGIRQITLNSLTVTANGTVDLVKPTAAGNRSVLVIGNLTFDGAAGAWAGQLDLSSNDMVIHGGNLTSVTGQAAQGYNGGLWNGPGGIVSSAANADTTHLTALGVIQNNQSGSALYTSAHKFDNLTPGAGDILVKYTYYGDTDLSGVVDGSDYSRIDQAYALDKTNPTAATGWFNGDFNYDGKIDGSDYTLMDNAFNSQGAALSSIIASPDAIATSEIAAPNPPGSAVPEPGSITLLLAAALGMLGRRAPRPQPKS